MLSSVHLEVRNMTFSLWNSPSSKLSDSGGEEEVASGSGFAVQPAVSVGGKGTRKAVAGYGASRFSVCVYFSVSSLPGTLFKQS